MNEQILIDGLMRRHDKHGTIPVYPEYKADEADDRLCGVCGQDDRVSHAGCLQIASTPHHKK